MRNPLYVGKKRKKLPDVWTQQEIQKLLNLNYFKPLRKYPEKSKTRRRRVLLQIMLCYYCGLRVSEMMSLKARDIDLEQDVLKVVCGKGGKDRFVPIPRPLKSKLKDYLQARQGRLFPSKVGLRSQVRNFQLILERLGKAHFNKKLHPHILRHSYATHVLEKTGNLELVRGLLGHSSIHSTLIYTHLSMAFRKDAIKDVW